jgi:hypothetical protein
MTLAMPLGAQPSAAASGASYVLLSDDSGGRAYIGLPLVGNSLPDEPIESFAASAMTGEQTAELFANLCLKRLFDGDAYAAARKSSGFVSRPSRLPYFEAAKPLLGVNKVAATELTQDESANGIASFWSGEGLDALTNRQYLRYSGGLVITGPVKAKNFHAPQCNLTLRLAGLTDSRPLLDGIQSSAAGFASSKRADKPKYGYAIWTKTLEGGSVARITANVTNLNKPEQTVHLTLQMLPAAKPK